MLITFRCKAYADITMFGDVGLQMLKMMGQSDKVPGAMLPEDVPAALARLKAAIDKERQSPPPDETDDKDDYDYEPPVSMPSRALPLIELLTAAVKEECHVMWEASGTKP